MLLAWHRWNELPRFAQRLWLALSLVVIAVFAVRATSILGQRLAADAVWDFYGFWVHGRAAWLGLDFYDNDAIRSLLPFAPRPSWEAELLVKGSVYPPFTSFLFAPFGALEYATAYWVWSAGNAAAAAGACFLAGKWLFRDHPHGWVVAALLLCSLRASLYTAYVQQSGFLILLLCVLLVCHGNRALSGLWIALAIVVKPIAAIFVLYPAVLARWRVLIAAAVVGAVLVAGSVLLWGPERWVHFFEHPPTETLPAGVIAEPVSQSIGAWLSRRLAWHERGARATEQPLFRALVASMLLLSAAVIRRRRREDTPRDAGSIDANAFALAAVVALALAIYPGTKQHYAVLLALPAWVLWAARDRLPRCFPAEAAAIVIAGSWAVVALDGGRRSWIVFLAWWALMLGLVGFRDSFRELVSNSPDAPLRPSAARKPAERA